MPKDLIRRVLMKIDKNYLPYEYFEKLTNFETEEILNGVQITRLPTIKGIYLHVKISKGTDIIEHYHNSNEYLYIKKGKVIINNKVELKKGESYKFKSFDFHKIRVVEDTEMYVQFIKDEIIKEYKK